MKEKVAVLVYNTEVNGHAEPSGWPRDTRVRVTLRLMIGQSVCLGAQDQIFVNCLTVTVLPYLGALSDERSGPSLDTTPFYPKKLTLKFANSGGRLVGMVCLWTKSHGVLVKLSVHIFQDVSFSLYPCSNGGFQHMVLCLQYILLE
jgi:hypothetical protein